MHHRLVLAGLAATGGLLTPAFLQTAVAAADVGADGADAFTIGNYTFDPFSFSTTTGADVEGFDPVAQLSSAPPLLELGGGVALGAPLASQDFEVFNSSGADLGSIQGNETIASLFGLTSTEFTVASVDPTGSAPADGGIRLRRVQPRQRVREHLHRHPRSRRHRHRHAGDADRRRQPGLAV